METEEGEGSDAVLWQEFLCHLRHMRRSATETFALVLLLALLLAAILPPSFRSAATLAVLPAPEYTVRPDAGSPELNNTALGLDQVMEAETELLDSDDLHEAALRMQGIDAVYPDLAADYQPALPTRLMHRFADILTLPWRSPTVDPAALRLERALRRFRTHLTVLASKDANVITVSFNHADPTRAASVLDALLTSYAARRSRLYNDPQISALQEAAEVSTKRLATAEALFATFKRSHTISDASLQRDLLLHRRNNAEEVAAGANADALEQKSRLDALSALLVAEPGTITLYAEKDPDTRVQSLVGGLQDLRARQAALRGRYLENSRTVQDLKGQISAREEELLQLAHDPSPSIVRTGRNPNIDDIHRERIRASAELAAAAARHRAAVAESLAVTNQLRALDDDQIEFDNLQREVSLATEAVAAQSRLLSARHVTEAEDQLRTARVRMIQPARVPTRPEPLRILVALAGALLAFLTTVARVAGSFMLADTIWTADGLALATGLDVLAEFPSKGAPSRRHGSNREEVTAG